MSGWFSSPYGRDFYNSQAAGSLRSAQEIVPLVLDLVPAQRIVDVGCGTGTWLSVFAEHGATEILGVDGGYVSPAMLRIPQKSFIAANLPEIPHIQGAPFDLVVSLEVAEHLQAVKADAFVDLLTRLGPIVLFSAAIPFQGGAHHVNEQWPEYWEARFSSHGFVAIDCMRSKIWGNTQIDWWYAQNLLVYAKRDELGRFPRLEEALQKSLNPAQLSLVHPRHYLASRAAADPKNCSLRTLLSALPSVAVRAFRHRLGLELSGRSDADNAS